MPRHATIVAYLALFIALGAPASAASRSEAGSVRLALTELNSGLRHSDGKKACGRMTLRLRTDMLARLVQADPSFSGMGCARIVDLFGRELYEPGNMPRTRIVVRGSCAEWVKTDGRYGRSLRQSGRWMFDGNGRRCP